MQKLIQILLTISLIFAPVLYANADQKEKCSMQEMQDHSMHNMDMTKLSDDKHCEHLNGEACSCVSDQCNCISLHANFTATLQDAFPASPKYQSEYSPSYLSMYYRRDVSPLLRPPIS